MGWLEELGAVEVVSLVQERWSWPRGGFGGKELGPGIVFLSRGGDREDRKENFGADLSVKPEVRGSSTG